MKKIISRVVLLSFILLVGLEPFAQAQVYSKAESQNYRLRPELRYGMDHTSPRQPMSLQQEIRMIEAGLNRNPTPSVGILSSFQSNLNAFREFSRMAKKWLAPIWVPALLFAAIPTLDSFLSIANAKEIEKKAPVEETGSKVTMDYPWATSGGINAQGNYVWDLEYRPSFSDKDGTWLPKAKIGFFDMLPQKATASIVPAYNTLKLALRRIWDQEHKPFLGGGATLQIPTSPLLQEAFVGMGGTLSNQEQNLPLLGLTTLDHSTEFWLDYRKDINSLRAPIMDKFNMESREFSLTTHAGFDPSTQKWIGFVQIWRHIGVFGGSIVNMGYAKGWNSSDYHHFIVLPTDNERFSIIFHDPFNIKGLDTQFDYLPNSGKTGKSEFELGEIGVTVDFLRQTPAAPTAPSNPLKSDPKSMDKSLENKNSPTEKKSDSPLQKQSLADGIAAAGFLGSSFFTALKRKFELFLKSFLNQERNLNIVFVDGVKKEEANQIALNVMQYYNQDETVLFVVKDEDTLLAMVPAFTGRKTLFHVDLDGSIFKGQEGSLSYLRLESLERVLPKYLKEGYKEAWKPFIVKNSDHELDFTGLSADALLRNVYIIDLKDLIQRVMNFKFGSYNLLQGSFIRAIATFLIAA